MGNVACPNCKSEDCQNFAILHAYGTTSVNTRTSGMVVGMGWDGAGIGMGSASTTGNQQTLIGERSAPPSKKKVYINVVICVVLILWGLLRLHESGWSSGGIWFLILATMPGFLTYRSITYNRGTWVLDYARWERSWLCTKCGCTFKQSKHL